MNQDRSAHSLKRKKYEYFISTTYPAHSCGRDSAERPQQVGRDARWGLERKHPAGPQQVGGQFGVDLHGEEESEGGVGGQVVQLLLQLHEPLRRQVHVLQHHPAARLARRVDRLVRLRETLR